MSAATAEAPRATLIVAVYNAAPTIAKCLDSVAAQTYVSRELIVIDGGSTDGTVDILRRNADQLSYWISEPDAGVYSAWNKALARARGDWIAFLGADDYLWAPDALERLVREGDQVFPRKRIIYGRVGFVSALGNVIETVGRPWAEIRDEFRNRMVLPHPGLLCHRSLFAEHGLFDESFRISGDYEWLLRELKDGDAQFIDGPFVVGMRAGGMSSQAGRGMQIFVETRLAQQKHGLRPHLFIRAWTFMKAYLRTKASDMFGESLAADVVNRLRWLRSRIL
ncbi:MAG: glycosyltransferase [Nitrospira sp. BO4]|jgi:glycosyltransferase involved in cell wall biosynthesis|nr:glycosyltransferase [Nitrospira sp. BO4]